MDDEADTPKEKRSDAASLAVAVVNSKKHFHQFRILYKLYVADSFGSLWSVVDALNGLVDSQTERLDRRGTNSRREETIRRGGMGWRDVRNK